VRTLLLYYERQTHHDGVHGPVYYVAVRNNPSLAIYTKLNDERARFYLLLDRADIYEKLATRCDFKLTFEQCDEDAVRARVDYEAARSIATTLGWPGLARQSAQFARSVDTRRKLSA